jgi:hypothetical protein
MIMRRGGIIANISLKLALYLVGTRERETEKNIMEGKSLSKSSLLNIGEISIPTKAYGLKRMR